MLDRRRFIAGSAFAVALMEQVLVPTTLGKVPLQSASSPLGPVRMIAAGVLKVGYYELGPNGGPRIFLLHGYPYDVHSYVEVAPMLAARGCRVIVPYLRGHGPTRFLDGDTPRSGQQAAIGEDLIALMDALGVSKAVLAGYDWGGRAACVVAATRPDRCSGLVSVNGYLIQDIAHAMNPLPAAIEAGLWYQFYFQTERGRAGLTANRRDIARILWTHNSPTWQFDEATFERSAGAFDNPDYVEVVLHSYRHRLGLAAGFQPYAELERRLASLPPISVPAITLDGDADGVVPASDGCAVAARFTGVRQHRIIPNAGHNLPQENAAAFTAAVWELVSQDYR